ncbi:7-cyano-7-deazaguanine synthase [Beggiatoa alba]|nr:7-cyano-7-deazaguanine synthase [Beggiatoa alba]
MTQSEKRESWRATTLAKANNVLQTPTFKKAAVEGQPFRLHTPLINMSKAQIICRGSELDVDYSLTVSCYQADAEGRACGHCNSCRLRAEGFRTAGMPDPTLYC